MTQSILIWCMPFHPWIPRWMLTQPGTTSITFLSVLSNHIPNKILTTRKSLIWITYHLQLQLHKRDKAYNKAKRTNSTTDWAAYRRLRNKGISLLRSAKRTFLKNLSTNLQSPKQFGLPIIHYLPTINTTNQWFPHCGVTIWPRWYIKQNASRMCLHHLFVPIYPFQLIPLCWHRSLCLENF